MSPIVTPALEVLDYVLFDTVFLPPDDRAIDRCSAFIVPYGHSIWDTQEGYRVKLKTDTNIMMCGMLPQPQQMIVRNIDCYFVSRRRIVPASSRWYAEATLHLIVNQKLYWNSKLSKCVDTIALLDRDSMWKTLLKKEDIQELRKEFHPPLRDEFLIPERGTFAAEISFSTWAVTEWRKNVSHHNPMQLHVALSGELMRPIQ